MKKVLMFVVLCAFVVGMSVPASALEVDFSGDFYVEGILNSAPNMLNSDSTSDYRQMRLRVQTDFQVSDNLKLTTRFDALEKVLSSKDSAFDNMEDDDNIDFDRAYLTYISPIGMFEIGRLKGVVWGTSFCDDESDTDRIKYTVPIEIGDGKLYMVAVAEKVTENNTMIDDDNDKYYLGGVYKTEAYAGGLLSAMYSFNKFQDPGQRFAYNDAMNSYEANGDYASSYRSFLKTNGASDELASYAGWYGANAKNALTAKGYAEAAAKYQAAGKLAEAQAAAQAAAAAKANIAADWPNDMQTSSLMTMSRGLTNDAKVYLLSPFFQGKFGDFSIESELDYVFGTLEYDAKYNAEDRDVKGFAYFAQGAYDYSPFTAQLGFAHASGDSNYDDTDIESIGYVSPGVDWEKLFILNADYHGMNGTLGNGVGNHVGTGFGTASIAMLDGYQMLYGGVDYAITDAITLGFIAAMSKADDVPEGFEYDDDQGMEYDFSFVWKITDNLTYKAIAAYLDGGDYWTTRKTGKVEKDANGEDVVDPQVYALFHRLTLTF
ncbi:MAG: hypothetical protein HQK69_10550 [Desulfamplus sp.]|nr:hypothetical protein [Desulfamplus sp.]